MTIYCKNPKEFEAYNLKESSAKNPRTPLSAIKILAKDKEEEIRGLVAENPSTPVDLLRDLAKDDHWWVRRGVAKNSNTPLDILNKLAIDAQ